MTGSNIVSRYKLLGNAIDTNNYWDFIPLITNTKKHEFYHKNNGVVHEEAHDSGCDYSYKKLTSGSSSLAQSNSTSNAFAVGIKNENTILKGKCNDVVLGIANAEAFSKATAISKAKSSGNDVSAVTANSESVAQSVAVATGIDNSGKISTGWGKDLILGIANAEAVSKATASSQAKSFKGDMSTAIADSSSVAETIAGAAGINNEGEIATGHGNDYVIGIANSSTSSQAKATAKAIFQANASDMVADLAEISNTAVAESTSIGVAKSQTTTLGINNSGKICTGEGADLILGIANTESSSNSQAMSKSKVIAQDFAAVTAEAGANALIQANAVGIINQGKIATGRGNDTIVGIALNSAVAVAEADAFARGMADEASSQTNTVAIADTSAVRAIGIDNSSGEIDTGRGNDRIIGYGSTVGILGGEFKLGNGHDRIIGYGSTVGIEDSVIRAGSGNDYIEAAKVEIDPLTGDYHRLEDQTSSIKNATIYGEGGKDTFKIGDFEGSVTIDGGKDFDVLKLWGDVDNYAFTVGSDGRSLTIEDSGSVLNVQNVEEFYLAGRGGHAYTVEDFA